ncbi:MAG: methyltransferase domain-containing protein [Ktedonobacteraceae bacterium]|nr:methyltransferase domain-containing protein [Ktedonobacteraceae bacterium]
MRHLTWDEVFARQKLRSELLPAWFDALGLREGDHVLDLGAGPGYVSLQMARRTGPTGLVYAVDREADALAFLQRRMQEEGIAQIRCVVADVASLHIDDPQVTTALLSMVLHHNDDPAVVLCHLRVLLPAGGRVVIAEFHPDGPALSGPPRAVRLAPENVENWCREAGLHVIQYMRQTDEHYLLTVQVQGSHRSLY